MSELLKKYYIPKTGTQQDEFLKDYPNFDGKGIKIAIIDSGIDVSLDGLVKTSEGLPKIIDCFDFTEAGNVNTSFITTLDSNKNTLIGLSGRTFKIPSKWVNPSGKFHLGIKKLYKTRCTIVTEKSVNEEYGKSETFPEIDCIVWFDGLQWLACIIDDSVNRNLEDAKVLTNYRNEHEYGTIFENLTFCVTIYDEGNLLEIFVPYINHGSTVAQIAASHFPDDPERDGLAPGAQIISMNVFHPLYCNSLDENALKKALKKCVEMKVDIINYSTGWYSKDLSNEIKEITEKHGIIFVQAVGNLGPIFSSIDSLSIFYDEFVLNIGAAISVELWNFVHKIKFEASNNNFLKVYSFSSRGPTFNGSRGVDFVAPGAAIVDLPKFNNTVGKWFGRGSSNAAPNASGAIACLISGLKQNSIKYSQSMIKAILSKTAYLQVNGNKLEFGNGMIKINDAFKYIMKNSSNFDFFPLIQIMINGDSEKKGIILKLTETNKNVVEKYCIKIAESLKENAKNSRSNFINLQLSPKEAEKYIEYSEIKNDSFFVTINSTFLESDTIKYAEIEAFDPSNLSIGSIFHLPITVISPKQFDENYSIEEEILLKPLIPYRLFIQVPKDIHHCKIFLTSLTEFSTEAGAKVYFQYSVESMNVKDENKKSFEFNSEFQHQSHEIQIIPEKLHEMLFYFDKYSEDINFKIVLKFINDTVIENVPKIE